MTSGQRLSYAVLRPAETAVEDERDRVLVILDTAEEAQSMAAELRKLGVAADVRTAVGYGAGVKVKG